MNQSSDPATPPSDRLLKVQLPLERDLNGLISSDAFRHGQVIHDGLQGYCFCLANH